MSLVTKNNSYIFLSFIRYMIIRQGVKELITLSIQPKDIKTVRLESTKKKKNIIHIYYFLNQNPQTLFLTNSVVLFVLFIYLSK